MSLGGEESAYFQALGIVLEEAPDGISCRMKYSAGLDGLGGLHGGTLSALLEFAATSELSRRKARSTFKLVSLTMEYLRPGRTEDTIGQAYVVREGRRLASIRAEAWQGERSQLIATASATFVLEGE